MFSDCDDDLCIFVCGTCKRYFTQLSAFAQHKKEKLCKKSNGLQEKWLANNHMTSNHIADETSEEVDSDENTDVLLDSQDFTDCSNEQLMRNEENDFNSQKRKYPRKQDKTKIKRTVRDFDPETRALLRERDELETRHEGRLEEAAGHQGISENAFTILPLSSHVRAANLFGKPSENIGFCRHPVYVCKVCHMEFPNITGKPYKCSYCRRGFLTERELRIHVMRAKHDNLCNVCGKIFPDKYKLRKHALSHVTVKNFPCDVSGCTKAFKSVEDVRTHVKYVHAAEKRFKCTQCARAFSRPDKYKHHMLTHKGHTTPAEGPLPIENGLSRGVLSPVTNVQSPLTNDRGLMRYDGHAAIVDQNSSSWNNSQHSTECYSSPTRNEHLASSPPRKEATNATTVATLVTADTSSLFSSFIEGANENTGYSSEVEDSTKLHLPVAYYQPGRNPLPSTKPIEVVSSEDCKTLLLNDSDELSSFLATNNEAAGKSGNPEHSAGPKYGCHSCGLHFDDEHALEQHAKIHTDGQVTAGEECGRCQTRFRSSSEFLAHEERRPDHVLRCEHCSLKFLNICELRFHRREVHNLISAPEVNPGPAAVLRTVRVAGQPQKHVCAECGKAFTRADKLRRHSIIHSPDRPCIPCICRESHDCPLTFYRKDSMKRHALTHTLEKPYTCDICDKTFSRQDYVTKHISQVHKRVFKHRCMLCDYGTREPKRLRIHIRSRHEMDPISLLPLNTKNVLFPSLVSPGDTSPSADKTPPSDVFAERKVGLGDLNDSDPLSLSEPSEVVQSSAPDETISEYVDEESTRDRHLSSTTNSAHFSGQDEEMMSSNEEQQYRRQKVFKSGHKTPLNSLTVPGAFCALSDLIGTSTHNVFSS